MLIHIYNTSMPMLIGHLLERDWTRANFLSSKLQFQLPFFRLQWVPDKIRPLLMSLQSHLELENLRFSTQVFVANFLQGFAICPHSNPIFFHLNHFAPRLPDCRFTFWKHILLVLKLYLISSGKLIFPPFIFSMAPHPEHYKYNIVENRS